MSAYTYYPGCSAKGTGRAYEESLLAVFSALGLELHELDDWNCCGATAYMSVDEAQATALAARNLALAAPLGRDIVAPCNACWLVLLKAQKALADHSPLRKIVAAALDEVGLPVPDGGNGGPAIRHPLDVLVNDLGPDALRAKVTAPLEGLKVAPYYGCQVVRPYAVFDDQHDPRTMDVLLQAAGATVVDFPAKTKCCGGSQTGTLPDVGLELVRDLMRAAHHAGADAIATVCPLCQFNLEVHQSEIRRRWGVSDLPVVYVTQLLGLALGVEPGRLGLGRSLVPVGALVERRNAHAV